jgi:cation:H+ antiporter
MLLVFGLYLYFLYRQERKHRHNHYNEIDKWSLINPRITWWRLIVGFIGVFLGSSISLEVVQTLVTVTWVSGSLLWVMTLWIASSLPELITSLSAIKKQAEWISIWTLIWSNIVNPLMGIGAWWIIAGYIVPQTYISRDLPVQIIAACMLLVWVNRHHRVVPKLAWVILILIYIIYILVRMQWFSVDF